ncbi:UDP-N-acetylglucosamine--N-acetylmuramyl-(pentapeptide) pyrophosphoryl-undecaprenol N-acetylglucosamine transferase [Niastella koreensis GR20-10]|uniref:UDP-N-acetylglucosamine--N-acetylmuramyl-(pentapeptide) pyrophosphoryl-undecaprenol N-acetylglucosamine transferase n=1 Tax=Niastella koreensis (strain DSM 17620 / KACC 11465 / NBRC 106392 / GR20-10) TaxID=700598 RepID=G8TCT3_NIAKG|nr:undecaprenyldiphospho-muramoylpentapeptide beta-N-acetylglucosaminyltransferase [Niastella koreensis]AEW03537.1 UDP-N-acetylglucosamine--N-acetylmuramyl-(pentapeptide) pyrophosphoryl-undecaprenol N-acetylglucosamine transferase [Niastella koreensis GR20-10]
MSEVQKQSVGSHFPPTGGARGGRIIIAGGGTGGHIFPAVAIAHALRKLQPGIDILFVGAKGKMEMEKVPQAGYEIKGLDIAGFNRSSLIKNIGLPFKLIKSFWQVRSIIKTFQPDAVIGVGGYSSFPVLRYAQAQGIATFIHEANSFAGKSNIMLGKKASKIFVATDGMEKFFPAEKIMITGNPVRQNIVNNIISRSEGIQFFGLEPAKKTVFVTGGSLGAKGINEAIDAGIAAFAQNNVQLIWQTGKPYADRASAIAVENKNIWANSFITQMEYAYAAADIVISRSGAMSVAELCVAKKPVIFVPFPFAAEDHQTANAQNLVNKQAGLMIKDSEAKEKLVAKAIALAGDEQQQNMLKGNIAKLAITNADEVVAKEILRLIS